MEFQYFVVLWSVAFVSNVNLEMYYIRTRLDFVVLSSIKYLEASPLSNAHVTLIGVVVAPLDQ